MKFVGKLLQLLLLLVSPALILAAAAALASLDLCFRIAGRKKSPSGASCRHDRASVVIPNWNGRDLLERYLPSVIEALSGHPDNEIIVVDNASTDGSSELLDAGFPQVRVIRCKKNLGFGGGSNLGFQEAKNDIVVLLNSDMRVERTFLAPLLEPFQDPSVFAVACQIFFSDPQKRREETGLTQGWWADGRIRVTHRLDDGITGTFPCFYAGGGSSAFDRRKFLELGGFDDVFKAFYYEDTDLGLMAWNAAGKYFTSPPASSITNIAAPSGVNSHPSTSRAHSKKMLCYLFGKTFIAGAGRASIFRFSSLAALEVWCSARLRNRSTSWGWPELASSFPPSAAPAGRLGNCPRFPI